MLFTNQRRVRIHTNTEVESTVDEQMRHQEQREHPRYLLKIPVVCAELDEQFQQISEFIPGRTMNVSQGGLLVVAPQELKSEKISVTFCDWEGTPFELKARVIHRTTNGTDFFTGLEFIPARNQLEDAKRLVRIAQRPSLSSESAPENLG